MHIVALSDLHGHLPAVPKADLVIIAGDVCPDVPGSAVPGERARAARHQVDWLAEAFVPWLDRIDAGTIAMCWGNHDYAGERPPDEWPEMRAEILTDREITIDGWRIYGTPWTFMLPDVWAFDMPLPALATRMDAVPAGIDILVTHGPAFGVLDRLASGHRVGSHEIGDAVARVRPQLHIFGHIHESRGQQGISYNVSILNERYRPFALPLTQISLQP
jgi:Icc-related predicted phosphoesterase